MLVQYAMYVIVHAIALACVCDGEMHDYRTQFTSVLFHLAELR